MADPQHAVELIHRLAGYPLLWIVIPAVIATFGGRPGHVSFGRVYAGLMVFLYLSGTFMTLTRHDWWSWGFARNVTFNLFGFSLVLYGLRAAWLYRHGPPMLPNRVDRSLAVFMAVSTVALFAVAVVRDTPMRVFAIVAVLLLALEIRDLRAGLLTRAMLFRRHVRFILGSCFYVWTVVSLVHLGDELPRKARWLWPTVIGLVVVYLLTAERLQAPAIRRTLRKPVVTATLAVAVLFAGYVLFEVLWVTGLQARPGSMPAVAEMTPLPGTVSVE